jgi:ABC-2 type transport system ATP-binding protein
VTGPATLEFDDVSKWYGDTVAVASLSFSLSPGVTGLLGHNGAGKSTALKLCAGFATPDMGTVRVLGLDPRRQPEVFRTVGVVPDVDGLWPFLSAREVVRTCAELREIADPGAATERVLATVELGDAADRTVDGFSKGMRQRVKLACALVHDPELLLLDEPLNGTDPAQRRRIIELTHRLGEEGRTVLISSHVLAEVERMAPRVVVLVNGRLVAEGDTQAIRELLRDRPRTVHVESDGSDEIARALIGERLVGAVRLAPNGLELETADVDALGRRLVAIASELGISLDRVEPIGDDLESVYAYLTERARGRGR